MACTILHTCLSFVLGGGGGPEPVIIMKSLTDTPVYCSVIVLFIGAPYGH
jgi:hypothetical protein